MVEIMTVWVINNTAIFAGGVVAVTVLTWILKKIPTEPIRKVLYTFFYNIGAAITKFFSTWKFTKAVWNNTLEPWLIGFLDMLFVSIMQGLFDGLRSDNPAPKK